MPIKYTPKPRKGFSHGGPRPNSGRPKGVKNDPAIRHIRELAREHTEMCIEQLVRLAYRAKSETAKAMAINSLLDRGWGRAPQSIKMSGDADNPVRHIIAQMTPEEAAEAYANTIQSSRAQEDDGDMAS